jgi:hypothetical protein
MNDFVAFLLREEAPRLVLGILLLISANHLVGYLKGVRA